MQPYIFPYIGYFQLIKSVDLFVMYDDVTFIKQGWINRNKILLNGKEHVFTVPLKNASSFASIANTHINHDLYAIWKSKFLKTLKQAYGKAPYYNNVVEVVKSILNSDANTISTLAINSVVETSKYLGINTRFVLSSSVYENNKLKGEQRVIDICKREKADDYINTVGGKELYSKNNFEQAGIQLHFIAPRDVGYHQFSDAFVPWLSVIDVMMFNAPAEIACLLNEYDLK